VSPLRATGHQEKNTLKKNGSVHRLSLPKKEDGLSRALLTWFDQQKRDLPWRHTKDPYRILVSEFMLQQTQVSTVIPYYERWIQHFPTVEKLAAALPETVLKLWEGLGYYSRARNLHRAAQMIQDEFKGLVPQDSETIRRLPGIGRYTAGAILSIAFDLPIPLVDGNVERVFARLFAIEGDIKNKPNQEALWQIAERLIPEKRAGDYNQSLMELGATLCTSSSPRCPDCPVAGDCKAKKSGSPERFPLRLRKKTTENTEEIALIFLDAKERALLQQRPSNGPWADLWEFPHAPLIEKKELEQVLNELTKVLCIRLASITQELPPVRYSIMDRRGIFRPVLIRGEITSASTGKKTHRRLVTQKELQKLTLSAPHRKIADLLKKEPKI